MSLASLSLHHGVERFGLMLKVAVTQLATLAFPKQSGHARSSWLATSRTVERVACEANDAVGDGGRGGSLYFGGGGGGGGGDVADDFALLTP